MLGKMACVGLRSQRLQHGAMKGHDDLHGPEQEGGSDRQHHKEPRLTRHDRPGNKWEIAKQNEQESKARRGVIARAYWPYHRHYQGRGEDAENQIS